ncbi:MAG: PaeR7I family type II restriction endonuclease [Azoarcus sp.]|nr:PaeR7I family type II restriction endonuclease [Azoarcus sp.]
MDSELGEAIRFFWQTRNRQQTVQGGNSGHKDTGARAAVTGGRHCDGFIRLLAKVLREVGVPDAQISIKDTTLPCYFRPTKDWDLIVKIGNDLLAVIEVKAHVGSFGNNFNNRVEEALGNATDFWAAYSKATFKPSARPWLGYLMMLEDAPGSKRAGRLLKSPHYPVRDEFRQISYAERYAIFCERLVRERLYDSTCFLMSSRSDGLSGQYTEPRAELSFHNFAASLAARALAFTRLKTC